MVKFVSVLGESGGIGKSFVTFETMDWLSRPPYNKHILLLDFDGQRNTGDRAGVRDSTNKNNTANILLGKPVKIMHAKNNKNLDVIPCTMLIDQVETKIANDKDHFLKVAEWIAKNQKALSKYDIICADLHPGFGQATMNCAVASDEILTCLTPDLYNVNAQYDLQARMNLFSKEVAKVSPSLADFKIDYVLNMIRKNTRLSRMLLNAMQNRKDVIAVIPEKELIRQAAAYHTSLAELKNDKSIYNANKPFFNIIDRQFRKIKKAIEKS